jgi:hypothetical protein
MHLVYCFFLSLNHQIDVSVNIKGDSCERRGSRFVMKHHDTYSLMVVSCHIFYGVFSKVTNWSRLPTIDGRSIKI